MTSKRELVFKAIRGEEVERVPVGFWFHFVTLEEKGQGLNNPRIFQKSVDWAIATMWKGFVLNFCPKS